MSLKRGIDRKKGKKTPLITDGRVKALSTIVWTPIQYVTVYFRDVPGAALLRHRNRAEITLLMYEQKAYPWI